MFVYKTIVFCYDYEIVKYIPSWFPGAGFRRVAAAWRKDLFHTADAVHAYTKDAMVLSLASFLKLND